MKQYIIRIADAYGSQRVLTVTAKSESDAVSMVERSNSERVLICREVI